MKNKQTKFKSTTKHKLEEADKLIKRYAFGSGFFGYIPFPVIDALGIMAVQRKMLFHLAKIYKVPFSRSIAKDLLTTLSGGFATRAAIPIVIKTIPGINILFGSTGMAAIGSTSTYAVGKVFQRHFEKGGTLNDFDPKKEKATFEAELKKGIKLTQDSKKKIKYPKEKT